MEVSIELVFSDLRNDAKPGVKAREFAGIPYRDLCQDNGLSSNYEN